MFRHQSPKNHLSFVSFVFRLKVYVLIQRNNFFSVNERTESCACFYGYFINKNLLFFWSKEYISLDCVYVFVVCTLNPTKVY